MRVLLVNDYGTPTGGAEVAVLALRDGLRRRGVEARLFASSARPGGAPSLADAHAPGTTGRWRTLLQAVNPGAARALVRELETFRPDVVHVNLFLTQLSPLILPALKPYPAVLHVHWYRPVCPTGLKRLPDGRACDEPAGVACLRNRCTPPRDWPVLMGQAALWRRWADAFERRVANSRTLAAALHEAGFGAVEVVDYGVPALAARPPLQGPPTVLFAGRLVPEKGADLLLRAFARVLDTVPAARLTIAGEGPEAPKLRGLAEALGVQAAVTFTGRLDREPLEAAAASAWVQAAPSRWREPFGLVAAEALMRGTAVVASAHGGLAEIVEHERTGLLVAEDEAAWAEALLALLTDPARAEALGAAGRQAAGARFDLDRYVDRMLGIYAGAREDHAAARPHGSAAASARGAWSLG